MKLKDNVKFTLKLIVAWTLINVIYWLIAIFFIRPKNVVLFDLFMQTFGVWVISLSILIWLMFIFAYIMVGKSWKKSR
jgi:hypothetical protein